ncbi:MAG: MBL fold metallo-hydrolase [Acholeplasmatales bacterium]|nr:MBL fold metallo-hydrolase [Acholeplasmatales bacterium]
MVIKYEGYSNSYLLTNGNKAILIDCGLTESMANKIKKEYDLEAILLTHGHYDHIDGLRYFKDVDIYIYTLEEDFLYDDHLNLYYFMNQDSYYKGDLKVHLINDGDILNLIGLEIKVIHTPGHTRGSVCYQVDDMLFTGDTLFNLSVGRTDFPTGNYNMLKDSLSKLKKLDKDFHVYPGHEEETSLRFEVENNRYFGE